MTMEPSSWLLMGIVVVAYAVQTAVGFGAVLVCITLAAHLLEIREIIALMLPLSILQCGVVVLRDRGAVDLRFVLGRILPWMGGGLIFGIVVLGDLRGDWLRMVFAGLVIVLAARELWVVLRRPRDPVDRPPPSPAVSIAVIVCAGVVHGVYATGGPLLVYALGRQDLDKRRFRATLSAVWLGLNIVWVASLAAEGRYPRAVGLQLVMLAAVLPLGVLVGDQIHRRVAERPFKAILYGLLIVAAASLLVR